VTRVPKRKQLDEPPPEDPPPDEPPPELPPPDDPPPEEPPPDDPPPELPPPELPPPLDPPPVEPPPLEPPPEDPALLPADEPTLELSSVLCADELLCGVELLSSVLLAELPGVVLLLLLPLHSVLMIDELERSLEPPPVGAWPVAQTGRYK